MLIAGEIELYNKYFHHGTVIHSVIKRTITESETQKHLTAPVYHLNQ